MLLRFFHSAHDGEFQEANTPVPFASGSMRTVPMLQKEKSAGDSCAYKIIPAASYSPRPSPAKYHRR